jgi:hypothetical protein
MWDYKRTAELAKGGKSEEIQYESSKSHYIYGHTPYVNPYNNPAGQNIKYKDVETIVEL